MILPTAVVLDTNFLTIPAQFGIDIFTETEELIEGRVEFVVLRSVMKEIESNIVKAEKKSTERRFRMALTVAGQCSVVEDPFLESKTVDDEILEYTVSVGGVLATNDRGLKSRARKAGIAVLFLRSRKHLAIDGLVL